jgi:hypothetical protein
MFDILLYMKKWWTLVAVLFIIIVIGVIVLAVVPAPNHLSDTILVDTPLAHAEVQSPLHISGKARGTFYFEATFPVKLKDADGNVLAQSPAQAQGNWETSDFVPFTSTLTFAPQPAGSPGTLVFTNDNPSGDPAIQIELDIPVTF